MFFYMSGKENETVNYYQQIIKVKLTLSTYDYSKSFHYNSRNVVFIYFDQEARLCFRIMAVIYTDMCLHLECLPQISRQPTHVSSAELRFQFLTSLYPINFTRVIKKKMHLTSQLWKWVLHCKALSTVIKESLRIQRLRHSMFARR